MTAQYSFFEFQSTLFFSLDSHHARLNKFLKLSQKLTILFMFVSLSIAIRNGKIVWKYGLYCWYFCLNLKYLGWPYRAYIKTAKNGDFWEELLSEKDFEAVVAIFCCYDHMSTLLRQFRRSLQTRKSITIAPCVL